MDDGSALLHLDVGPLLPRNKTSTGPTPICKLFGQQQREEESKRAAQSRQALWIMAKRGYNPRTRKQIDVGGVVMRAPNFGWKDDTHRNFYQCLSSSSDDRGPLSSAQREADNLNESPKFISKASKFGVKSTKSTVIPENEISRADYQEKFIDSVEKISYIEGVARDIVAAVSHLMLGTLFSHLLFFLCHLTYLQQSNTPPNQF